MIEIGKAIVSLDVFEKKFVCNIQACKGQCCIDGDAGAPLDENELAILDDIFEDVKPYLRKEGVDAIEKHGKYVQDWDKEFVTPLINDSECAYVTFDDKGIACCGIEQAHNDGKIDFKKPISCHLYPIRISKYEKFDGLNYHEWGICSDACSLGDELGVQVYKFLKEPLIRKYGEDWYKQLEAASSLLLNSKKN
jgi:hypothetical protein